MPELRAKKVGIIACSGEELPEGTITRLAALRVLEQLRPQETVTLCLPLFLAGGESDRAFARFYPTIAIDGCDKRCAARGTETYSGKPAASLVVSQIISREGLEPPAGLRQLNAAGQQAVEATARQAAGLVDELLGRAGQPVQPTSPEEETVATCSCGSGIPVQTLALDEKKVTLIALPLIFQMFRENKKAPGEVTAAELLEAVKIYNPIPAGDEAALGSVLLQAYAAFWQKREAA